MVQRRTLCLRFLVKIELQQFTLAKCERPPQAVVLMHYIKKGLEKYKNSQLESVHEIYD